MRELLETIAVPDVFVTGLHKMEYASTSCMRFYFYADQDGERVLAAKLVVPVDCITEISAERVKMMARLEEEVGILNNVIGR
jgi:hypothetical protein